mmetsp:Transcript_41938/g.82218  ORF Transcript_41938/g.82218 Transcript_41938/m.82218 type:complete len:2007 (+) Transcript_41938:318-6338(+)|eukprot:CAMPEP_0194305764 /NCGR_PEP_ID=MMETSP0171-20130528/3116_1 /TAXON_ID=218684 /ORGANISM="Corethron pennatum, Strain L29A3" /LENGTH=2006 /DNA_ID=CAMNT_0039057383 /DNA_START=238 /DNA_END=6258 /DNA_ORIENTATION=+
MELGSHVWLRSPHSQWGWVPAIISRKETEVCPKTSRALIRLWLRNESIDYSDGGSDRKFSNGGRSSPLLDMTVIEPFETSVEVDPEQIKLADHPDVKIRNRSGERRAKGATNAITGLLEEEDEDVTGSAASVPGGVDDLISLTHLHEPAILHALRVRYANDVIYTATGPILIAVNPFKDLNQYGKDMVDRYRQAGEAGVDSSSKLSPHVYKTADGAYRAMMRGVEEKAMGGKSRKNIDAPADQSILVSGESGAGKTVTTKFVLSYLAVLSESRAQYGQQMKSPSPSAKALNRRGGKNVNGSPNMTIEQQVLQSNPILESFGNARTIRNDNSSRFGKYIDISFQGSGQLAGAVIETYLLEKVRLVSPGATERNYHIFYELLASATPEERKRNFLGEKTAADFRLLSQTGTFDRRDGVSDSEMHSNLVRAMGGMGFKADDVNDLMRFVSAVLFCGEISFERGGTEDSCKFVRDDAVAAASKLLGVDVDALESAMTSRYVQAGNERIHKPLDAAQASKAIESLIKATYGAAFDHVVRHINGSIHCTSLSPAAHIGVLDIFGFESFDSNNFEQLCINYTNEALQQQFNRFVFKLEQEEYRKEGIQWEFITFPDNKDVLDLIDKRHTGMFDLLDEQCIMPRSTDEKLCRYFYDRFKSNVRFTATPAQQVDNRFSIEHYAGPVEYSTNGWLEKNRDHLPTALVKMLHSSTFSLMASIVPLIRSEERVSGRGAIATKSVGKQFCGQLQKLRQRIDQTVPHYIRCLKPNDGLVRDRFEPRNIVEQLRHGGVLEAVRVSRAGFPTRYAHDVFVNRYYILGGGTESGQRKQKYELKPLVEKIALEVWSADQNLVRALEAAEDATPKGWRGASSTDLSPAAARLRGAVNKVSAVNRFRGKGPGINISRFPQIKEGGPATISKRSTSKRTSLLASKRDLLDESAAAWRTSVHEGIGRPTNKGEFDGLDFNSRCALAGMQVGKTKVFLRREAFDRIESMRSGRFFGAAAKIQAAYRMVCRQRSFRNLKVLAIAVQKLARGVLARKAVRRLKKDYNATVIQSTWRMSCDMAKFGGHMREWRGAIRFQKLWRGYSVRKVYGNLMGVSRQERAVHVIQQHWRTSSRRARFRRFVFIVVKMQAAERRAAKGVATSVAASYSAQSEHRNNNWRSGRRASAQSAKSDASVSVMSGMSGQSGARNKDGQEETLSVPMEVASMKEELYHHIQEQHWATVEKMIDSYPKLAQAIDLVSGELPLHIIARQVSAWTSLIETAVMLFPKALVHRDRMGALPIHHASAHDSITALEILYRAYPDGAKEVDVRGRLPIHVAAEFDAVDALKFLLENYSDGAYTMVHRPAGGSGGGLPLHVASRNYASIGVITALLAENFASAKRTDENGDLPLHLILACGEVVDQVIVKTLLTCFSSAVSRTDSNGDMPLAIALKNGAKSSVVTTVLLQYPEASQSLDCDGHSSLYLAFEHGADDQTILRLLNHAPELSAVEDRKTGMIPIQVATKNEASSFIVHHLLKRDMPIDMKEKVRAQLITHHFSWNHLVSNTDDLYHDVVTKILQQCTQPQVLALAHVEGRDGKIALASASPVCKHELRVMLRLFNTLEVVNQRPAFTNAKSDTQIFYALRYDPPSNVSGGGFTVLHEDKGDDALDSCLEDMDDGSVVSNNSLRSNKSGSRNSRLMSKSVSDKLRAISEERGQQVIAKLTSRSEIVEKELKIRKDYRLSRQYVPAIISVHHTVQHAAYSEALAEPGYCITMEGADSTAENLLLDYRKAGKKFSMESLKRIGISLLHLHEHGIIHGDFGTHNVGKFGGRWKLLGVGGAIPIRGRTDPSRGFYHPPEAITVETKRSTLGKKTISAKVNSVTAAPSYDIWAFGVVLFEALADTPLAPYACRGKRAMSNTEMAKIGKWDDQALKKSFRAVDLEDADARDLFKRVLHPDPEKRIVSMRAILEHRFFAKAAGDSKRKVRQNSNGGQTISDRRSFKPPAVITEMSPATTIGVTPESLTPMGNHR